MPATQSSPATQSGQSSPLSAATNFDVVARYCSNVYVYKLKGSGSSNKLVCTPALNAPPAYVQSTVYGTSV